MLGRLFDWLYWFWKLPPSQRTPLDGFDGGYEDEAELSAEPGSLDNVILRDPVTGEIDYELMQKRDLRRA